MLSLTIQTIFLKILHFQEREKFKCQDVSIRILLDPHLHRRTDFLKTPQDGGFRQSEKTMQTPVSNRLFSVGLIKNQMLLKDIHYGLHILYVDKKKSGAFRPNKANLFPSHFNMVRKLGIKGAFQTSGTIAHHQDVEMIKVFSYHGTILGIFYLQK